jgi:tripartite-type tricarboxylate transporter receptor subunit TctC
MKRLVLGLLVFVMAFSLLIKIGNEANAADKYPSKQINWYIHSSAGGGTDIFSRTAALRLRRILKAPIVISTMSGGSGSRMLNYMLEQPADGYTIYSITNSVLGSMAKGTTKARRKDITGIARGCYDAQSFCVSTKGRFKTIQELVEFGKKNPKKVKFGVAHMGGIDHLSVYEFAKAAGFEPEYVPFKGGGEIIVNLMGGSIDAGVLNPSEFAGQYDAGNVKPVVFLVSERLKTYSDVPTAKENGWDVEMATWRGVIVKAGTPEPIVEKLRASFQKTMKHKIYQNYLEDNSMGPESILTGPEWEAFLDKKWPMWVNAMETLGYTKK